MAIELTRDEVLAKLEGIDGAAALIDSWLARGDGAAVYENHDMGHAGLGDVKVVSYGSPEAQLEADYPPTRLPDIGSQINWRYTLVGVCR